MAPEESFHRIITNVEELDELRAGAVVRDGSDESPTVYECQETGDFMPAGSDHILTSAEIQLPATVLDEGSEVVPDEDRELSDNAVQSFDPPVE